MLFKDGQVAATKIGALPKNQLKAWIELHLDGVAEFPNRELRMPHLRSRLGKADLF